MGLLPMDRLGAREVDGALAFGIPLPGIVRGDGRLLVKVIHERDQFLQGVPPHAFELEQGDDPLLGAYWSTRVDPRAVPPRAPGSSWGTPGRYVYRYCFEPTSGAPIDWIVDPFAREFGVGKLSAITLGYEPWRWSEGEASWRTPALRDLVVYELQLEEFAGGLHGTLARLEALQDLGVNCVEVMPPTNVSSDVDWGYLPIGYFGIDERFGKRRDFQALVDHAHRCGIAVIVDAVYGHTAAEFGYVWLYGRLGRPSPMHGPFAKDYFGESTDFRKALTRDYFLTVNDHWLSTFHVDGFRYDCVPNYWDGATGDGYAALVYETYQLAKRRVAEGAWRRFEGEAGPRIIQCAEQLEAPVEVLRESYSSCCWQNETLDAARGVAHGVPGALEALGFRLGLAGYPDAVEVNGERVEKAAFQYVSNHDHSRFVAEFGVESVGEPLLDEGARDRWYKVQPYLVGLFAARGVPMIFQGDEICESYVVPDQGFGRVRMFRPVRWELFYDEPGRRTMSLVRRLIRLRRALPQLREGDHDFYNDWDRYLSKGVLVFHRRMGDAFTLVALNFGDVDQEVELTLPLAGDYREELEEKEHLTGVAAGAPFRAVIPGNFGRVWTRR